MADGRAPTTCALGVFSDMGVGVFVEEGTELEGRYFYIESKVTERLEKLVNDDVLPQIEATAKYLRVIRVDEHTLFGVHSLAAKRDPARAWTLFSGTFRIHLQDIERNYSDLLQELKIGHQSTSVAVPAPPSAEPSFKPELAVHSETGSYGTSRDM